MEGRTSTEDRISELPDNLLTQILSLLPAEEVFRTCILSKRWKCVWASVPVLVFDDHKYSADDTTQEEIQKREAKFEAFVYGVLCHRENLPLDTFKLKWSNKFSPSHPHISEILSKVAYCMPRVLSICNCGDKPFNLLGLVFRCVSIEEMSLAAASFCEYASFVKGESVNLHRLRKLEFGYVDIDDDNIRMLLSGCPVLEELVFSKCWFDIGGISSTVLTKLALKECFQFREMWISCPNLVSLGISCGLLGLTLKDMPCLSTADLFFDGATYSDDSLRNLKLLGSLSNVASLKFYTIYPEIMDFLVADIPNCRILKNLKSLELGELNMNSHWNLVACLLLHSPNLKTLTLQFCESSEDAMEKELLGDFSFQLEYLETVKIGFMERNAQLAEEVVRILRVLIKTIGKVVILRTCWRTGTLYEYSSEDEDEDEDEAEDEDEVEAVDAVA